MRLLSLATILLAKPATERPPAQLRERVLATVRKYPGFGIAEIARQTGTSAQLAEYHLHALQRNELVGTSDDGGRSVYFPAGHNDRAVVDRRDRNLVATLRRPMALRIALQLLEDGHMAMGDLAAACGISASTATHHLKRLQKADVVNMVRDGRSRRAHLEDEERLKSVLRNYPPPRDTVSDFIDMWERLSE